jgi:hypothetical protein
LRLGDLDLARRVLWVWESKGRSRLVPFGADLAGEFRRYLRYRRTAQPQNLERLRRWYRGGGDVASRLPWLSVYMGHANILGTETYLNATPELLALTARRFEARFRRRSKTR